MPKKITIKELSQKIGVSTSTISRVLTARGYVKEETRQIVEKALQEYEYFYRDRKKSAPLAKAKNASDMVFVFAGDLRLSANVEYIPGIASVLEANGLKVAIIDARGDPSIDEDYFKYAMQGNACGAIMLNVIDTPVMENMLRETDFPIVLANRYLRTVDTDIVCSDNYRSGYVATRYLIDHNHRHIAHLAGPQNSTSSHDIMRGYIDAMADAKLPIREDDIYYGNLKSDSGRTYAKMLFEHPDRPTAVFCTTCDAANGLVYTLFELGLSIPQDLSVVCTQNSESSAASRVPLTCIAYDHHQMGVATAEMLLNRIQNPRQRHRKVVYMPTLIERSSVATLERAHSPEIE